ncbi:cupin domain-containing protein [Zoogloea sp.]|uniref:cupin domain-containing protein n=1 Tax=Zoogloea sp. TaxID=49181 RepID=UPI0035B20F3F
MHSPRTKPRAAGSSIQPYAAVTAQIAADKSITRELMPSNVSGNTAQSLMETIIPAGARTMLHRHRVSMKLCHVTHGKGVMTLGREIIPVKAGDTLHIPPGTPHCIEATGRRSLRILSCSAPAHSQADTEILEEAPRVPATELNAEATPGKPNKFAQSPVFGKLAMSGPEIVRLRQRSGLIQKQFWGRLSVTQSGGSRYESGRDVPEHVLALLHLAYGPVDEAQALLMKLREPGLSVPRPKVALLQAAKTGFGAAALRDALRLNQTKFWGLVGFTQSGGSRYESGRDLPPALPILLHLVFGTEQNARATLEALRGSPGNGK